MNKKVLSFMGLTIFLSLLVSLIVFVLPGTPFKSKDGTNTNAADKDLTAFYQELEKKYPDFYQLIPETGRSAYTIPGLLETETLGTKGEQKGNVQIATDMTPQGLSIFGDYMVISAYSKSKGYLSVLWLIDKNKGKFIKTIVLPTISHVGGMAYDNDHDRLWITTTDPKSDSQISAISLKNLLDYDFQKSEKAIEFDFQRNLKDISKSSYMTYHDQALFVGYFDKDEMGHIGYFKLDAKGFPQEEKNQATAVFDTPKQIQGMAIWKDQVIFSQSYGNKDSKLLIYDNPGIDKWREFLAEDPNVQTITAPAYMQQVMANKNSLYLLFESSATKYRLNPKVTSIDRVIEIKLP